MTTYREVVERELRHSFYTGQKRNEYNETRVNLLVDALDELRANGAKFKQAWVEIFTVYPDQEALRCIQRIYKGAGLPIPEGYQPVVNAE